MFKKRKVFWWFFFFFSRTKMVYDTNLLLQMGREEKNSKFIIECDSWRAELTKKN